MSIKFFLELLRRIPRVDVKASRDIFIEVLWESILVVGLTGIFVGAILTNQIQYQIKPFQATSYLGGLSLSTLLRQVGPLFIAFILSGKVVARLSAELSYMKSTEQLDNLVTYGVDVLERIALPRLLGVALASSALFLLGLFFCFVGGFCFSWVRFGIEIPIFFSKITQIVHFASYASGFVKSFVFGSVLAVVSCYEGFFAAAGSEGVAVAVRKACVKSILIILIINWAISQLFL